MIYSVGDLDNAVAFYMEVMHLSPAYAERILAALEKVMPRVKYKLSMAHARLQVIRRRRPPAHTVPMSFPVALAVAWALAVQGHGRVGGVLLIQAMFGLRPGEALGLEAADLVAGVTSTRVDASRLPIVLLGPRRGTKAGRPQFVVALPRFADLAHLVLMRFKLSTPGSARLSHVADVGTYSRLMRRALAHVGTSGAYSPHSPRAGWATDAIMQGTSFTEVQERGRWLHPQSLRTYLDVAAVLLLQTDEGHLNYLAVWLQDAFEQRFPWWQ